MKTKSIKQILILLLAAVSGRAPGQDVQLFIIEPFPLEITYNKTVNLIFPYEVKSVDKGSRELLAQKARGVENILQLKAASRDCQQTNLTVITSDGKLYSFVVSYSDEPSQLNIELIKAPGASKGPDALLEKEPNKELLKNMAQRALEDRGRLRRIKDNSHKAHLSLSGIFIDNDVIFYRLKIGNRSNISYQIDNLRFFITDKKRLKRTSVQQTEITPLYVHGNTGPVEPNQSHELVFALSKFTIPDAKELRIQLMEKNGGRHLELSVQNKEIIRATPLH
jgi:conjugative transposon TraN protein